MMRFGSLEDSMGDLLCSSQEKNPEENCVYSREFQSLLDSLDEEDEECGQSKEKKRRLSKDQVKALEKIFEIDNKLDPDHKAKIAQELGLHQRQVAIWFQNRRARWKTKKLEKDFNHLQADYEALKLRYDKTEQEREILTTKLRELKAKLGEENTESHSEYNVEGQSQENQPHRNTNLGFVDFKGGLLDSNCGGVLNEEGNLNLNLNSHQTISPVSPSPRFDFLNLLSSSSSSYSALLDSRPYVKMEEQTALLLSEEDQTCNIFSVDHPPNLYY